MSFRLFSRKVETMTKPRAPTGTARSKTSYEAERRELLCCLLWLRNHFETKRPEQAEVNERVLKRVHQLMEKYDADITIADMRRFREENPG